MGQKQHRDHFFGGGYSAAPLERHAHGITGGRDLSRSKIPPVGLRRLLSACIARHRRRVAVCAISATLINFPAFAGEPGIDHSLLGRYPGSQMEAYASAAYDEFTIPLGTARNGQFTRSTRADGKVTYIKYGPIENRSSLEVMRNFEQALKQQGFQIAFGCGGAAPCQGNSDSGSVTIWSGAKTDFGQGYEETYFGSRVRALTAHFKQPGKTEAYVHIKVGDYNDRVPVTLYIFEIKPMEGQLVRADAGILTAEALAKGLAEQGRVAMYLNFDFNKATLRPDALPTLEEVVKLVNRYPALRVRLEGHTDNAGTAVFNEKLSLDRAQAVRKAIVVRGIKENRLEVAGFGATKPLAGNDTEEGRARNRRVEIVDLTPGAVIVPAGK